MKRSYFFHVHYADVGMKLLMKPHIFEEIILNSACRAADDDGFGIPDLNRQNKSWVLARFQLDVTEWPALKDDIEVETWVESYRMGFSIRNFRIYRLIKPTDNCQLSIVNCQSDKGSDRQLIAISKTAWAVIDLTTRENVNVFDDPIFEETMDGEPLELKISAKPDKLSEICEKEYTIQYADIDQNGHCNSARYPQIMLNAFGDIMGLHPRQWQISYSHELRFGERVKVTFTKGENPFFRIYNEEGLLCTSAIFIM